VKVLFLITGLRLGGAENQLLILAKNLSKHGIVVSVVSMELGGGLKGQFETAGIEVNQLSIKTLWSLCPGYFRLKKLVSNFKPDIIHSHMIHANLFARVFKLFNHQYKLINTAHNIKEGSKALMKAYALSKMLPDWSTNVSREAYDSFIRRGYFDLKRSSYIPNAIDTERYNTHPRSLKFLHSELELEETAFIYFSAGRLEPQKNYAMLLQSFALVRPELPQTYLVIAGEGQELNRLQQISSELRINNNVVFLGRRDDLESLLEDIDCFVLSSNFEGFGMAVAEAMAVGKHVIATDCGGVKEVMGGLGQLVDVGDIQAFAKAMIRAYQFPALLATTTAYREQIVSNYSVPGVVNTWLQFYDRIR
jgi:glycosyltransferase involved in cell wall biosynthesis